MSEETKQDWSQAMGYVSPEGLASVGEKFQYLKERSYDSMQLHKATRVLDLGCGIGIDTVAIAGLLDPDAAVYGIDHDREMLRHADERASSTDANCDIIHQYADVLDLPFPDDFFDASRAERLFQNLPKSYNMNEVLDEILRVMKKGGRIVLMDADFGATSVDFEDTELANRLLTFYAENLCPNGYAGRRLYALLKRSATENVTVEAHPIVFTSFSGVLDEKLCRGALEARIAEVSEIEHWRTVLRKKSEEGTFYCNMNVVLVSGEKS